MAKSNNFYDQKDNFWGSFFRPVTYKTVKYETPHKFSGNKFNIDMVEGQKIDAKESKSLGVEAANLKVNASTKIHGEITFEGAAYKNSLGAYEVTKDGTLKAVTFAIANVDGTGATFDIDTSAKAKSVGFFIIPNGFERFGEYSNIDVNSGKWEFITNYGRSDERATKVTDNGGYVSLVHTDAAGKETAFEGPFWHTTERGGSNALNRDGVVHSASGIDGNDKETLKIAFEDLHKEASDFDYNDVVFNVKMSDEKTACVPVCQPIIDWSDPVTTAINNFVNINNNPVNTVNTIINNVVNNDNVNIAKAAAAVSSIINVSVNDDAATKIHG